LSYAFGRAGGRSASPSFRLTDGGDDHEGGGGGGGGGGGLSGWISVSRHKSLSGTFPTKARWTGDNVGYLAIA